MYKNKKIIAIIPARGGSKGVPKKNIRKIVGKPLIAWSIEAASKSRYIDRLILSSDDKEIIQTAKEWGCEVPFVRPAELAQDQSKTIDAVLHALRELPGYEYVVCLQATTPLTAPTDIDGCIEKCISANAESCVSIVEPEKSPYWMLQLSEQSILEPLLDAKYLTKRRQELPLVYVPNGAIYVCKVEWLIKSKNLFSTKTIGFIMPASRSLDIDTEQDFAVLESLCREK